MGTKSESVSSIPLAQDSAASMDGGQFDAAGHVVLKLLHKAAGAAEATTRRAFERSEQLSNELHAAQNRVAELEGEVQYYRDKADCAEEWLRKISAEIEDRLINRPEKKQREASARS
jgi:uncharacterized protein YlxW (UPF0749 family)